MKEDVLGHVRDAHVDKLFVVLVRTSGKRFELGCREWDAAEQSLGPVFRHETWDRRDVADAAIALLGRVFRPVYSVENIDPLRKMAQLKVRAGGLPMGDPDKALVRPGDVLQPLFRYLNREQAVQRIQTVPWTFLVVDRVDGSAATCSIVSGMRGGLGTNRRRRVEAVAVRVRPAHSGTRVQLVLQSNRAKPLAGHQVLITRRAPEKMNDPAESVRAVTDRDEYQQRTCRGGMPLAVRTDAGRRANFYRGYLGASLQRDILDLSRVNFSGKRADTTYSATT